MNHLFTLVLGLISVPVLAQLAQVKPLGGDEWAYINPKGEMVIEPVYEIVKDF